MTNQIVPGAKLIQCEAVGKAWEQMSNAIKPQEQEGGTHLVRSAGRSAEKKTNWPSYLVESHESRPRDGGEWQTSSSFNPTARQRF